MNKSSQKTTNSKSQFQLRTILETSRLLIESRDTDLILDNLLDITMGKMLVPRGAVLLYEPDQRAYTVTRVKGKATVQEGDQIALPWKSNQYQQNVIDPAASDIPHPELFVGKNRGLFFNLKTSSHHLGYLYLGRKGDDGVLNEQEIEFVESLSIISAAAISNSMMFSEMRTVNRRLDRRVNELNTLFDLSKDFSMTVNPKEIAGTFKFALLAHLLVRKFFLLFLINDHSPKIMSSSGLTRMPTAEERHDIFDLPKEILHVQPHQKETIPFLKENDIAILVALQLQGDKIAVVGVSEKANHQPLSQSNFNFLQSLGNLAVLSIQKTILLKEHIEKERLEKELIIAQNIQKGLYPGTIPEIPTLSIAAKNIPSQHVGGDYYDVVYSPDGNPIIAIGDVTGKGFPAALLMANLQSMLHVLLPVPISLSEATGRINNLIFQNTPSDKFITFFWAKYSYQENRLRYINAGHNPPLLIRNGSDTAEQLDEGGMILGVMSTSTPYKETDVTLRTGDILVCYTDGVTECFDKNGVEYGEERLTKTILSVRDGSPEEILDEIVDQVNRFSNNRLSDDLTLIVIKVT